MRPSLRSALLLAGLCGAGCDVYPDSPVFIYGKALRADGSPYGQTELSLEGGRSDNPSRPLDFTPYGAVTTHDNGAFALEILAGDIVPQVDGVNSRLRPTFRDRFRVATPMEQERAAFISFTLSNGGGDSALPVMRVWEAKLAREETATGPVLSFAPLPPVPQPPGGAAVETEVLPPDISLEDPMIPVAALQLHGREGLVWHEDAATSPRPLPPWLMEDFDSPEAQVRVVSAAAWNRAPVTSPEAWLRFRLEWRSERLPIPAGTLRPLSRGAGCYPALDAPCPFTDGVLTESSVSELWPGEASSDPQRVGVSLDAPARVSRVVIRNLVTHGREVVIEGSEDEAQWTELARRTLPENSMYGNSRTFRSASDTDSPWDPPLPRGNHHFLDVPLPGSPSVRYVRLVPLWQGTSVLSVHSLAELSLFE